METNIPPSTGSVGALPQSGRPSNFLPVFMVLVIMPLCVVASLIALELFRPDSYEQQIHQRFYIPPLYRTSLQYWRKFGPKSAEQKQLDMTFERLCSDQTGEKEKIVQTLVPQDASFDEMEAAIQKEKMLGAPEPLALLRNSIVDMVFSTAMEDTKMGRDTVIAVSEDFSGKHTVAGKKFADRFFAPTKELNDLFLAFQKAGFTDTVSRSPVEVNGKDHDVTNLEVFLYSKWYAYVTDPSYTKLKLSKRTQANANLVAYLEQVKELLVEIEETIGGLAQTATEEISKGMETNFSDALAGLSAASPTDAKTGFGISILGEAILHERKDFNESFRWQLCAAQKYYDPFSMYNISGYFAMGVEATTSPDAPFVSKPLPQDIRAAYYWNTALVLLDTLQYGFFTDTSSTLGWNTIAAIDAIQQSGQLTPEELASIEKDAHMFLEKKYPDIGASGYEESVHSMRAVTDALQGAGDEQSIPADAQDESSQR